MPGSKLSPPPPQSEQPEVVPPQTSPSAASWFRTPSSWPAHPIPQPGFSHQEEFGAPSDYARIAQLGEEVWSAIEVLDLNEYGPQLCERVSVRPCTGRRPQDVT